MFRNTIHFCAVAFCKVRLTVVGWMLVSLFLCDLNLFAQTHISAEVTILPSIRIINVNQVITYTNNSSDTLSEIYVNDWNNAFSSKTSPLGKHFSSTFIRKFHFSTLTDRGETKVDYIKDIHNENLQWNRPEAAPDLIKIDLEEPLKPGESTSLKLRYALRIPKDNLTRFGIDEGNEINLKYWLMAPAIYRDKWYLYSHKNLDDQFQDWASAKLLLHFPKEYQIYSGLKQVERTNNQPLKEVELSSEHSNDFSISLMKQKKFDAFHIDGLQVFSNVEDEGLAQGAKYETVQRIVRFLQDRLGSYPHANLYVSQADYLSDPVYGLNQLPDFIRPYSDVFQYDMKMFKTLINKYINTSISVDKRKEEWVVNAIAVYLMMDYVETYYPDMKLIGKLSKTFGLRWTHLAELDFNARYQFFFMNMNRLNLDQPLTQSKDSLVKFNQEIANPFKAGIGLKYLEDFSGQKPIDQSIKAFFEKNILSIASASDFEQILKRNTTKNIDWFFKEYVATNEQIDFKIKKVRKQGDSLEVSILNKKNNSMPVSLYGIDEKHKKIVSKTWMENTKGISKVTIPSDSITRLGLNYEGIIPEVNQRNNYKNLRSPFNKPLQFRVLKDVEDPHYTQFFFMPEFSYNLYDGFVLGSKISNQAILSKNFSYSITPQYGFRSRDLVGRMSLSYKQQFRNQNLHEITYGAMGNRYSYAQNLFYHRFLPYVNFSWRHRDLRNKERQGLLFRSVMVNREKSAVTDLSDQPNYNVFNVRYNYNNTGLIDSYGSTLDFQLGKKFGKVSFTAKYRKLFLTNQQLEFRLFAGSFLFNKTTTDYFSFGLDRPTDYLFDANYYGRSESSGIFSQQFIESEGGFKSQLSPAFANRWMTTLNTSMSFYKDILYVYGDVGLLKNKGKGVKGKYDTGVRVSLVQDYFELFFPVYSNLGWEITQPHYDQKIRFIVTLDFQTLMGLFSRTYY